MYYLKYTSEEDKGLRSFGIAEYFIEVGADGFVLREIGFDESGKVVHRFPGQKKFFKYGERGFYDLQPYEVSTLESDLTKEEFEELWEKPDPDESMAGKHTLRRAWLTTMKKIYFGWFLLVSGLSMLVTFKALNLDVEYEASGPFLKGFVSFGAVSILVFWIWMFSDFFKRRTMRYKILWGWLLLIANWLAAVVYFVTIYFPQERRSAKAKSIAGT
jgi:hypothetical protein